MDKMISREGERALNLDLGSTSPHRERKLTGRIPVALKFDPARLKPPVYGPFPDAFPLNRTP